MESITLAKTEINPTECSKEQIFSSRISLEFSDPEIENTFNSSYKSQIRQWQCIITGFAVLLAASVEILYTSLSKERNFFIEFNYTAYITLSGLIISTTFVILCLNFFKTLRVSKLLNYISAGIYLISIGLIFHFALSLLWSNRIENENDAKHSNFFPDVCFLIVAFSYLSQAICLIIFDISVTCLLIVTFLQICFDFLFNYFLFYQCFFIYTLSYALFLLVIYLLWYIKNFILRIDFFIYFNTIKNNFTDSSAFYALSPIENIKHSYFVMDTNGKISYMNKSCKRLVKYLEKNTINLSSMTTIKQRESVPCLYEDDAGESPSLAYLILIPEYWSCFVKNEAKLLHHRKAGPQLSYVNERRVIDKIFNSIVNINEDLPHCLLKYLQDCKKGNPNITLKEKASATNISSVSASAFPSPAEFSFEQFIELVSPDAMRKKSDTLFSTSNKATTYNRTEVESIFQHNLTINQVGSTMNFSEATNLRKSHTNILRLKTLSNSSSYVYIGKSLMKINKGRSITKECDIVSKEFDIFFRIGQNRVEFMLEDNNQLLLKDRKDTVTTCRSLFLSKIAHEFRNPICNILEIVNFLNDDLHKDLTKSMNNSEMEIEILSNAGSRNTIKHSDTEQTGNVNIHNLSNNLILLKNICEMMHFLLKDFTFYSKLIDDEELYSEKVSTLEVEESVTKIISKQCDYKKIIQELVEIFSMKANTDRKENKLKIVVQLSDCLPEKIDCDKDIFTSLMFNLLYHAYKTTQAGVITINVSMDKQFSMKKYLFEVSIVGVSKTGNLVKIMKSPEIIKKLKCEDIHELELEEEESYSNSNSHSNSKSKSNCNSNSQQERSYSNLNKNNTNIIGAAEEISAKNIFSTTGEVVDLEKYHLKRLFEVSDVCTRNSIIEEFNDNFSIYISHIYAKKLFSELQMENTKHYSKLFFYVDQKFETPKIVVKNTQSNKEMLDQNIKFKDFNIDTNDNATYSPNNNMQITNQESQIRYKISNPVSQKHLPTNPNKLSLAKTCSPKRSSNTINNSIIPCRNEFLNPTANKLDLKPIFQRISKKSITHLGFKDENIHSGNCTNRDTIVNSNILCMNYSLIHKVAPSLKTNSSPGSSERESKKVLASNADINFTVKDKIKSGNNILGLLKSSTLQQPYQVSSRHMKSFHNMKTGQRNTLNDSSINLAINLDNLCKDKGNKNTFPQEKEIRVLLVDDESLVRKGLTRFFNSMAKEGGVLFDVQQAENGFECLNLIYKYQLEGKFFDALIIDENMPYLRGSQIIRLLRGVIQSGEFVDFSIISYTSYDSGEMREYLLNEGANYVINKPVKFNDFKTLFYEAVRITV